MKGFATSTYGTLSIIYMQNYVLIIQTLLIFIRSKYEILIQQVKIHLEMQTLIYVFFWFLFF